MVRGSLDNLAANMLTSRRSPSIISILSFLAMGVFMPFFSAELWQRVYAAKDVRIVKRSLVLSAIAFPVTGILLAVIGVSVSANLKGIDPDMALIEGLEHLVPPGLLGLGLVIFLASIMSSADSLLFANTSILLQDFYARSRPMDKEKMVTRFRYTISLLLAVCFTLAVWLQNLVVATYVAIAFGCIVSVIAF
jgi:Na+/proline symporter